MMAEEPRRITVGRIGPVHGLRGWVKIRSLTVPPEKILEYQPWWLETPWGCETVEVTASTAHGNSLVVQLAAIEDREQAKRYTGAEIQVNAAVLPPLEVGEYYWYQLEGLRVVSDYRGKRCELGRIDRLMETGANDVLVVRGGQDSVDKRERLIPYLPEQTVKQVDLAGGEMVVDWDPDF
jgi:16S rRNA processing protein RimM